MPYSTLYPPRAWIYLPGGHDRLVFASRAIMAFIEHADSGSCVDDLEQALQIYGTPRDLQHRSRLQYTSESSTGVLKAHGIAISMDGRVGLG